MAAHWWRSIGICEGPDGLAGGLGARLTWRLVHREGECHQEQVKQHRQEGQSEAQGLHTATRAPSHHADQRSDNHSEIRHEATDQRAEECVVEHS